MIIDARNMVERSLECDILIMGSGAAGITLAEELDDGKRRIIIAEAGGLEVDDALQPDSFFHSIGEPAGEVSDQFHAYGGMTRYWTGRVAMLDPIDLALRAWVPGSGWPIAWDEFSAFEDRAMAKCGFSEDWRDRPAPLDALQALSDRPAIVSPYAWRFWSVSRERYQHWGERVRARFTASKNVKVLLHGTITGVAEWQGNKATSFVLKTRTGEAVTIHAGRIAICGGGVENARLLLNWAEEWPMQFAKVASVIGRYFMQHFRAVTGIVHANPSQSLQLQTAFNRFRRPVGVQFETGVCLTEAVQRREQLLNAAAWLTYRPAPRSLKDIDLLRSARSVVNRVIGREPMHGSVDGLITLDVEQEPCRDSRIFLAQERDRNGMKQAIIDWRISKADRRTLSVITVAIVDWLNRLGLGDAHAVPGVVEQTALPDEFMLDSHHHIGATRISESPEHGVVDANLCVHGTDNIYVCGASVMPTGGHANPTLTIVALAVRLADHLAGKQIGP